MPESLQSVQIARVGFANKGGFTTVKVNDENHQTARLGDDLSAHSKHCNSNTSRKPPEARDETCENPSLGQPPSFWRSPSGASWGSLHGAASLKVDKAHFAA